MGHTPGPWIIRSRGENADPVTLEAPEHIVLPHTFKEQTEGMTEVVAFVDAEANARVVAAAPDLLAACEAVMNISTYFEHGCFPSTSLVDALKLVRTSVAKAKGVN